MISVNVTCGSYSFLSSSISDRSDVKIENVSVKAKLLGSEPNLPESAIYCKNFSLIFSILS